MQNP
ncbi:hypothetical protein ZOSMA_79G00650, partial [Zostera marina]